MQGYYNQCSRCGTPNTQERQFCYNCGNSLVQAYQPQQPMNQDIRSCPNCSSQIKYGAQYCTNCGMQFSWPSQQGSMPQYPQQQGYNEYQEEESGGKRNPALIGVFVLLCVILIGGGIFFAINKISPGTTPSTPSTSQPAYNSTQLDPAFSKFFL